MNFISKHALGIAIALFIVAGYIAASPLDNPSETDALQASADIDASLAAITAAANNQPSAQVASKE